MFNGLLALAAAGCQSSAPPLPAPPPYRVHAQVFDVRDGALPARIVLLPPAIEMYELGDELDLVVGWGSEANVRVERALLDWAEGSEAVTLLASIEADRSELVEEHTALFSVVARAALSNPDPGSSSSRADRAAWWHRIEDFDGSVGGGLAALAARTGVGAGLFVTGFNVLSSDGRRAANSLALLLPGSPVTGAAYLAVGVVDLGTGDLLWVGAAHAGASLADPDLRLADDAAALVRELMEHFPGVDEYAHYRTARASGGE